MKKLSNVVQMSDGHRIYLRMYEPESKPIGIFHILHGMAEHGGRYDRFATLLCEQGFYVAIHDHRGHGKTAELNGKLGYFADQDGFNRVVQDVYEVMGFVRKDMEFGQTILFGHSMGSFLAHRFMQLYSDIIDKCILCGTGSTTILHRLGNRLAKTLASVQGKDIESRFMNDLSFGSFNKHFPNPKTAFDWLCSDEDEVDKYIRDPHCGFIPTNQFFADLTDGLLQIHRKGENERIRKSLPILLISGSEDPVGNKGTGVYRVANELKDAKLERVVVYLFEHMRHEILNEKNNQHVYHVITRWLEAQ